MGCICATSDGSQVNQESQVPNDTSILSPDEICEVEYECEEMLRLEEECQKQKQIANVCILYLCISSFINQCWHMIDKLYK